MSQPAFTRSGAGAPLVLLHALGLSRRAWDPVIPTLSEQFDVIAADLPGFGESSPLPPSTEPAPAALAAAVAGLSDAPHPGHSPLGVPVTVAFGTRDLLLLPHQSRRLDQLPPTTRHKTLPGCGHVPIADNPSAVTTLIAQTATRAAAAPAAGRAHSAPRNSSAPGPH